MKCLKPIQVNGNYFNCGHCMNCRINYTQMWSLRLMYELSKSDSASFVTLTYNNENLPLDYGLHKDDVQKFMKRLRKNFAVEFHEFAPKLKYYFVGEYGGKTLRPHYHAIIFNLDNYDEKHRELCAKSWQLCEPWFFDKNRGRSSAIQEVTPDDIQYVTGYVQKKLDGELGEKTYGDKQPPFSLCSRGLGLDFCMENAERLINNGWTYFKGHKVSLPRYFADKLGVAKSDYLHQDIDLNALETSIKKFYEMFEEDMKRQHTWYPENAEMTARRFKKWYERKEYDYANRIYKDFLQRQKLKGVKL